MTMATKDAMRGERKRLAKLNELLKPRKTRDHASMEAEKTRRS